VHRKKLKGFSPRNRTSNGTTEIGVSAWGLVGAALAAFVLALGAVGVGIRLLLQDVFRKKGLTFG
jgi:hypothetical protein